MYIYGVIPYEDFKERILITKQLQKELKKVKITVDDELIHYEYRDKSRNYE